MDSRPHLVPSVQIALLRLAPSKFAFRILEAVKSDSTNKAFLKEAPIKEVPLNLVRVRFALSKLEPSKFPPSSTASYRLALKNEDSAKLPFYRSECIIILLSKLTLMNEVRFKLELGR